MNENFKKYAKLGLLALVFSLPNSTASAQTCGSQPTCESLGFIYNAKLCPTTPGKSLICPFDSGAYWCPDPIDPQPETCPTGTLRPDKIPWSVTLEACAAMSPTWCRKCANSGMIPTAFLEAQNKCEKKDNGFGLQDIFSYAARDQGLLGSGTWNLNENKSVLIIGGKYCQQNLKPSDPNSAVDFYTAMLNVGYAVVVISPDSTDCPTSNTTFKDTFMGINLQGSADNVAHADSKSLGYNAGIMLVLDSGKLKSVTTIDCSQAPVGSSFSNQDGTYQ